MSGTGAHSRTSTRTSTPRSQPRSQVNYRPSRTPRGSRAAAKDYFIEGFTETFREPSGVDATWTFRSSLFMRARNRRRHRRAVSLVVILTAIISSDLEITGTWPIHGTSTAHAWDGRKRCRHLRRNGLPPPPGRRPGRCSLSDFNRALRRELKPAVHDLQAAGILPVDLAQAAMGPGMQVYSRYRRDPGPGRQAVPVEHALRLINAGAWRGTRRARGRARPLLAVRGGVVGEARLGSCPFGEADQLARPQGISVDDVIRAGVADIQSRLRRADRCRRHGPRMEAFLGQPSDGLGGGAPPCRSAHRRRRRRWKQAGSWPWLGPFRDSAQALVYRLHDIAAKKSRTKDQERYNALIGSWSDLLAVAATAEGGLF